MMPSLSRRHFLCLAAMVPVGCSGGGAAPSEPSATTAPSADSASPTVTTAAPSTAAPSSAAPTTVEPLAADPFTLGVASGDPDATSVVLWTRLAIDPLNGGGMTDDVEVRWEASANREFTTIDAAGFETATSDGGHSVHALAELPPGEWFYRFHAGGFTSPVGRTVIADPSATLTRFGSGSCQNYEDGYYHAHRDVAEQQLDFFVWLGDYMYEGAAEPLGGEARNVRSHDGAEPTDLVGYRSRYALYRLDENLQASHASCPWFAIWDDHEVENDYAGVTPQDLADAADFTARRQAAYQAWWEHMPVRLPPPSSTPGDDYPIHRQAVWASLVELTLLDGRQYRSDQSCGSPTFSFDPPCDAMFDDTRTMLGVEQEQFLERQLGASQAAWKVLAQQTVMTDLRVGGAVLNYDQWDGYPAAKERLFAAIDASGSASTVVLTGDIHLAGAAHLRREGAPQPLAVEFIATSISSNGNVPVDFAAAIDDVFPDVVASELLHRGYVVHTVTADEWLAEYRIVDDVKSEQSSVSTWQTFRVAVEVPLIETVS